jgi:hypothetical protein
MARAAWLRAMSACTSGMSLVSVFWVVNSTARRTWAAATAVRGGRPGKWDRAGLRWLRAAAEVTGPAYELEKRSLKRRGSNSLNWTFTHERLRLIHQRRRRGTPIRAIFSLQPRARSRSKPCI